MAGPCGALARLPKNPEIRTLSGYTLLFAVCVPDSVYAIINYE